MCYIVNCVHTKRVWTCIIKGFMIDNKKQDCKNLSNTWSNTFGLEEMKLSGQSMLFENNCNELTVTAVMQQCYKVQNAR